MNTIPLPTQTPFDYQLLMDRLGNFAAPRNKIQNLCRNGEIIRIKKGLYVGGSPSGEKPDIDPNVLSGLIYGPSYVSLESALSHYGLIPERVDEITCITSLRKKSFQTPLGRFSYTPINERVFPIGVRLESGKGGNWFLAEPEKAICDRIAKEKSLQAMREVPSYLEDHLRIDPTELSTLRLPLVQEIAELYRKKNVRAFSKWLARHIQ